MEKERIKSNIKFVGLHAHTCVGSPFDGLGYPKDHFEYVYQNGMNAMAITEHGNMNSMGYMYEHAKKMEKTGKDFKTIWGIESYYHPSIENWKDDKEIIDKQKDSKKKKTKDSNEEASFVLEDEEASKASHKNILNHRRHLVLLAQNQTGLNNLYQLVSKSFQNDYYYRYPRIDFDLLKTHNEGIIASSACLGGYFSSLFWMYQEDSNKLWEELCKDTQSMLDIFGDRFYCELQWNAVPEQHEVNNLVIKISKEFNIPLISTADSHYPSPNLWKDRELYKKLGWLNKKTEIPSLPSSLEELGYELYPKNGDQMWESYKRFSNICNVEYDDDLIMESLERTHQIAYNRIEKFYPDNTIRLPNFVVPEGKTATFALSEMAIEGLKEKGLHTNKEYVDRLKHELKIVNGREFSKYFLTMKAISDLVQRDRLTGPGRGSAGGSLLAYVLNITQADPIKYNLQFERFLRSDDTGMPDIDYDCTKPMEFKEQLIELWGEDNVVPIGSYNTLQPKSLIKDISKFYGIEFQEVNAVTSVMEKEAIPKAKAKHGMTAGLYKPTFEELEEFSESLQNFYQKYPDISNHVKNLRGQVRSASKHAAGVLISENLNYHMPLVKTKNVIQTPWAEGQTVRHLEPMGFIKFDILGLKTLEMIETAIHLILSKNGNINLTFADIKQFYNDHLNPINHDFDDIEVYKHVFHNGNFAATFQFSENWAQRYCTQAKPSSIGDLSILTSLLRPGPMGLKAHEKYINIKNGLDNVYFYSDEHKEVTEASQGVLVFQEQIASLAHKLGKDISLDEGNILRKKLTKNTSSTIGKRVQSETEAAIYNKFVAGCKEKGLTQQIADNLWESFVKFASYGFNASHAVCYSMISYMCAWLLYYYPAEWLAAYLTHVDSKELEDAISTTKRHGLKIAALDINNSEFTWQVSKDGKELIPPLTSIKGVGEKATEKIVENKPFYKIEDLIFNENIPGRAVGKKELDALIRAGALNSLIDDRFTGDQHFWSVVAVERPKTLKKFNENIELFKEEGEFSQSEKLLNIQSLTGNYPVRLVVTDELLNRFENNFITPLGGFDPEEPLHRSETGKAVCWFIPYERLLKKTKKGNKPFWILKCVDLTGAVTEIKCWGVKPNDNIVLHRPYMGALDYDDKWGFSTREVWKLRLMG